MSLGHVILTGVLERSPRLRIGSAEHELSWAPHFIDRLDYTYTQRARRESWHRFKGDALPSHFFHRDVFPSFPEDGSASAIASLSASTIPCGARTTRTRDRHIRGRGRS